MEKITIRLNGSSFIHDMELSDRYKVINESLWISLLSLVGNPEGVIVPLEGKVSPFLTMDVEKRLAESLEEKPADFLIVDMCYTAGHGLYQWKDQYYTKNPKFLESEFFAEHEHEMEYIDVMRDREFDWKPFMDRYIELIRRYFDKNHIILVKSRCAAWYAIHTHVRPMAKKNRRVYNRRIKELEDYFAEKTDPYVIDIYSHYFNDFYHKKGFTMASYEKPFYHHARKLVSAIIRTQPEKRVFTEEEYFLRLGRFIKYYDNLYDKNRVHLLMDDKKFIDHLVLQLSREILVEYESDFVEIEAKGYSSIEEILNNHNFKFAASLKQCLEVVQAVEEGDIFREGVSYEVIFRYHLKVIDRFAELVKDEFEKGGWLDGEIYMNRFHCQHYYFALRACLENRAAALKKYVIGMDKKPEEQNKRKALVKAMRKEYGEPLRAYVNAMNRYFEPILVDLWGSCITREILNEDTGRFRIGKYAYRNSFLFAFDEPIPYEESNFDDLSLFENSSWRVGYIRSAFHKDLPADLQQTESKWLLVDFYDLICDVVEYHGGVLTADREVRALKFYKQIKDECTLTSVEDVLDDEEIRRRMEKFIQFIKERYGKNIVFIRADVKTRFLDYQRQFQPMRGHKKAVLLKKKEFLNRWQDYFEEHADCYVIDYARQYKADDLCVSGAFMVHYQKEFYERGYEALVDIIYRGVKRRRFDRS